MQSQAPESTYAPPAGFAPAVTQEAADAVRARLARRLFAPSTNRLPDEVLPDADLLLLDQGQEAISVGVAVAALLNYLRARQGEHRPVSARMLHELARLYDEWPGEGHEGTSLAGAMAALACLGVCLEEEWPMGGGLTAPQEEIRARALQNRPATIRRVERRVEHLRAAVFEHGAVAVGANIHEGWMKPQDGTIPFAATAGGPKPPTIGAHAFAVIGYTRDGFLVQGSWGQHWGGVAVRDRTQPGVALWRYEDAAANLTDAWVVRLTAQPFRAPLVGYDPDSLGGTDHLEIRREVAAFSYLLTSRSVRPPLAIGLFGDWGSGKSFFMEAMRAKIDRIAERAAATEGTPAFCRNVVPVRFNAWHYLDTDLWASLVTEIFDRLFARIGGGTGRPEDRLPQLTKQLEEANGVYQQAKAQLADAERARVAAETALKEAVAKREEAEAKLATQLDDVRTLVGDDPRAAATVEQLAKDLGVPEVATSYQALEAQASEVGTLGRRWTALMHAMFATPWGWMRLLSLGLALAAPVLVVVAIELVRARTGRTLSDFHSFAVQVSALLAACTTWLGAQAKRGSRVLDTLESTHRDLERIRATRRAAAVAGEERSLQALSGAEEAARKNLAEAETRVRALEAEIAELQPGRLITRFIEERSRSTDYRSRLGIVSLVRRDFERLSQLADPESTHRDAQAMPVERIILYIDDLDRCAPERVVEVLEAVHLLLAFPLFMVVVAVDPRWLRRCLEQHYPDLLALRSQELVTVAHVVPSRPATAQDYLEKIFQIPFSLQPLRDDGYRRLLRGLTSSDVLAAAATTTPASAGVGASPGATAAEDHAGMGDDGAGGTGTGGAPSTATTDGADGAAGLGVDGGDDGDEADDTDGAVERLTITEWELEDMQRLSPLFHTPRAVKRFVNSYRLLRAGVQAHEMPSFTGTKDEPGTYRAALVLLAIVVSHSNVAPRFLRRVLDAANGASAGQRWAHFVERARADGAHAAPAAPVRAAPGAPAAPAATSDPDAPAPTAAAPRSWEEVEWQQLCGALLTVSNGEGVFPVREVGELEPWIPVVARHSFSLSALATIAT